MTDKEFSFNKSDKFWGFGKDENEECQRNSFKRDNE